MNVHAIRDDKDLAGPSTVPRYNRSALLWTEGSGSKAKLCSTVAVVLIFEKVPKNLRLNITRRSPVMEWIVEDVGTSVKNQHIVDNNLFSSGQSSYRSLHFTVTHFLKNTDDWNSGLDLYKLVGLTFIDLKKVVDTLDHEILCKTLDHYGIQQREMTWFISYLFNRKQFCQVNGISSKVEKIDVSVSQGSCLGPVRFLMYLKDLPPTAQHLLSACMLMIRVYAVMLPI